GDDDVAPAVACHLADCHVTAEPVAGRRIARYAVGALRDDGRLGRQRRAAPQPDPNGASTEVGIARHDVREAVAVDVTYRQPRGGGIGYVDAAARASFAALAI